MEQRIKAVKVSSKVMAVLAKIGYISMIVTLGICAAMLIYMAVTGGETSMFTIGETNIIIFDKAGSTPAELAAICAVLIVMGGIFLAIFRLAYRMFHEISVTGKPFEEKYPKTVRVIAILTAVMSVAVGIAEGIAVAFAGTEIPDIYSETPGIVVGVIIYCLSYIIDYGCGLEKKPDENSEGETL